jgi:transcriptional regulator CtsR
MKHELQKAQNIIDALFYDEKAITQWEHRLLENIINEVSTELRKHNVMGRSELLLVFVNWINSNTENLIDESWVSDYLKGKQ